MRRFACYALAALGVLAALQVSIARDIVPAERRWPAWSGHVPACDDPAVIGRIQRNFERREVNHWASHLKIDGVDRIRPIAFRPWGRDYIPRRYCEGRALMSDGRARRVSYNIIESGGIIGATWGVEWCVAGLDPLFYYAPGCKMARP